MTSRFRDRPPGAAAVMPQGLSQAEIDALLEQRLIANLASVNPDGSIHLVAMWFRRDGDRILLPTSHHTRKAKNLRARPSATVMIDRSVGGLDLRGVVIRGAVELVEGDAARSLNRSIHERYVSADALALEPVAAYLNHGDDLTIAVAMERVATWNLADGEAGRAIRAAGGALRLDA
jgi:nitroimidazol reductase NimA-like FMN-containing flavoprotein (pyridoxamine 5'-phosphate oxidase superfamily)